MRIGIDLDNTLVRYDDVFHRLAHERGLIDAAVPPVKDAVRDALRRSGREDAWTELQGCVYGPGMEHAEPFDGALEFLRRCRELGVAARVISHRTRTPFLGPAYDLHASARAWLARHGIDRDVWLEETKAAKLCRIAELSVTHFVDDLPEFLTEPGFPDRVARVLFDPSGTHAADAQYSRMKSWPEIEQWLLTART